MPSQIFTLEKWKTLITSFETSNMSTTKFCSINKLSMATFYKWKAIVEAYDKKSSKPEPKPTVKFLPITVKSDAQIGNNNETPIKIQIENCSVLVSKGFDQATLKAVFETIKAL